MSRLMQRLDQGKLYHSISEVCNMTGLEPHVLRYWETEFSQMRPKKNSAGNRAYRSKEIQYVHYIRYLLHDEKFTIQGAKKKLSEVSPAEVAGQLSLIRPYMLDKLRSGNVEPEPVGIPISTPPAAVPEKKLEWEWLKEELQEVLRLLDHGAGLRG